MSWGRGHFERSANGEHIKIDVPVTLPQLAFLKAPLVHDEAEAQRREVANKFTEHRIVAQGRDAWAEINRVQSFESWVKIGRALQIGRDYSLKTTGANRPMGQVYCRAFSAWLAKHEFTGIQKSVRSSAVDLVEHLAEVDGDGDRLGHVGVAWALGQ